MGEYNTRKKEWMMRSLIVNVNVTGTLEFVLFGLDLAL